MTGSTNFLYAFLGCAVLIVLLYISEVLVRRQHIHPNITRRIAHIVSGFFALLMHQLFAPVVFLTCNFILLVLIVISYRRDLFHSIHHIERKTYGELFLPLGILLSYVISHRRPEVFIPAILIVTIADACAGIIGDLQQNKRASRIGSVAFFIISVFLLHAFTPDMYTALSLAFILTIVEQSSPYGTDNLTIPLAAATLLSTLT